jgi:sialic acid synthase SpsE
MRSRNALVEGGSSTSPYFICEINTSHFGSLEKAKRAILAAKNAGATAVKFQSWSPTTLYSRQFLVENAVAARIYEKFAFKPEDLAVLSEYCWKSGIGFSSTAYSKREVRDFAQFKRADFIKIASMDFTNSDLVDEALNFGIPVVLSTGMATEDELVRILNRYRARAEQITILHCNSLYPTKLSQTNMGSLHWLKSHFQDYKLGFSDHTTDSKAAIMALTMGARVFEKHMSLEKDKPGLDNAMALGEQDFSNYVSDLLDVHKALDPERRVVSEEELEQRSRLRRSAHAKVAIKAGDTVSAHLIDYVRPGIGLSQSEMVSLIGKRFKSDVESGHLITRDQID